MTANLQSIKIYSFLALSIALLQGCASLPKITAVTKGEAETTGYSGQYDSESKLRYSVEYDSANVYLYISTADFSSQVKILNFGLTIYIDETGKKKKEKYITFPLPHAYNKKEFLSAGNFPTSQNEKSQQLFQFFQMNNQQLLLGGFDGPKSTKVFNYPAKNSPVQVNTDMNFSGILNYTAVIPKAEIFGNSNPDNIVFSLGIKSGAAANQMNSQPQHSGSGMKQGSGGGKSGGMGGRGGGGRSGGGGGMSGYGTGSQNRGNFMEMVVPIEFWFQVDVRE
ncbi:MAG: hypothetical protein AB7S72_17375 [Draconibacterium sp.]